MGTGSATAAPQPTYTCCAVSRQITVGVQLLHLSHKPPDTVGEVGSSGKGGKARGAGGGAWDRLEPGGEALEVERGRGRHVLQVRPGQPSVARLA
jgi:hypothetical protein